MKKKCFSVFLLGALSFASCTEDGPQVDPILPEPPQPTVTELSFKSLDVLELKEQLQGKDVQNVPVGESTSYFGSRAELSRPDKLRFKDDSLFLLRANEITERYKVKWQNKELLLHHQDSDSWSYMGQKTGEKGFLLNVGFYALLNKSPQRSLSIIGREYALQSFANLTDYIGQSTLDTSSSVVWMKVQCAFE